MEGLKQPVGPENARVYWVRRAVLAVIVIGLLVGMGFLVANLVGGSGNEVTVEPVSTVSPTPDPSDSASPTASTSPSLEPEPANTFHQTGTPSPSDSPNPSEFVSPTPSATPTEDLAACKNGDVSVYLSGPRRVHANVSTNFQVSIVNDSPDRCRVEINAKTFELKITSGTDQVWSSLDCVRGFAPRVEDIGSGGSAKWTMEWRVNRSIGDCEASSETLMPGTYVATATLSESRPSEIIVQLR